MEGRTPLSNEDGIRIYERRPPFFRPRLKAQVPVTRAKCQSVGASA